MNIVFDLDNTLADELGATLRPGILDLLGKLKRDGHVLILWTNSRRQRARQILKDHQLLDRFSIFVYREDYDPKEKGLRKDIRLRQGDFLVDDNPAEIEFVKSIGKRGFLLTSYRKGQPAVPEELSRLLHAISKSSGLFGRLFR